MSAAHSARGFTLVELLVASLIALMVVAGALTLIAPAQDTFQAQPEIADQQQRVRVSIDVLVKDLMMAGAGTDAGPAAGALTSFLAPLMPYRAFGSAADSARGVYFRSEALSFVHVPSAASQTTLSEPLALDTLAARLDAPPNCPPPTARSVCGFEPGDRVMLFDNAGNWDVFNVESAIGGDLVLQHRGQPVAPFEAGTHVVEVEMGTYYLGRDASTGVAQLTRYDGWVTDSPVVDNLVGLEFRYFGEGTPPELTGVPLDDPVGPWTTYGPAPPPVGLVRGGWPAGENCTFMLVDGNHVPRLPVIGSGGAPQVELTAGMLSDGPWCPDAASPVRFDADLLRVRRVHVSLRVQSALASLRGPAGLLFTNGGTARAANRYVPDLAVQFEVVPRNMNLAR